MAQRQMEERVEGTEKEILSMKEMLLEMKKSVERILKGRMFDFFKDS